MKFLKSSATLFLLFIGVFTSYAQNTGKFTGSVLWKISGKDLKEPSYIIGTHHWTDKGFLDSIPGMETAIKETQQVVGELVLTDMPALQAKMKAMTMMPEDQSYKSLLSVEDYDRLENNLSVIFGNAKDQMLQMQPALISLAYAFKLYREWHPEINFQVLVSMDSYFQQIATEAGKPVIGLETVDEQIQALFFTDPLKKQAEDIVCLTDVDNKESMKKMTELIETYYRNKNLSAIYDLFDGTSDISDPCPSSQENKDALNKNRNEKWMRRLPGIMSEKPSLIVVGAMHLAGDVGLLNQLSKQGYEVEAMK